MTQKHDYDSDYDFAARKRRSLWTAIGLGVFVVCLYAGYFLFQYLI
ncbi:MAG: hypothetical protein WDZ86_05785 [Gammaproteobacteria bacterium]